MKINGAMVLGRGLSVCAAVLFTSQALGQPAPNTSSSAYAVLPSDGSLKGSEDFGEVLAKARLSGKVMASAPSAEGELTIAWEGKTAAVVAVPQERVKHIAADLTARLTSESGAAPSALSDLRDDYRAASRPMILVESDIARTAIPVALAAQPAEFQINEAFAAAIERARVGGFSTSPGQLQLLPSAKKLEVLARSFPALKIFAVTYSENIVALKAVLQNPTDATTKARLVTATTATYSSFVAKWPSIKGSWEARRSAIRAIDGLGRQTELKSVYGVRSEFEPESYQSIFLQSGRSVAIHDQQGRIVCSGLAVTPEWIMTAGHCFIDRSWQYMSASYNLPGSQGRFVIKDAWPNPPRGRLPADQIDYAFVRVDSDAALSKAFKALEDQTTTAMGKPLCIRERSAAFEEPVIVIAQLSSNRRVYDHAYVWYPYAVLEDEFERVSAMTGMRLHRFAEAAWPDSQHDQEVFFESNMTSFEDAYGLPEGEGATRKRQYNWTPAEATSKRPMFGFDTDTVEGNSGGAVFGRTDACILGVFNGGQPDNVTISEASWREHEFATPIAAVLGDLESAALALNASPADATNTKRLELVQRLRQARQ